LVGIIAISSLKSLSQYFLVTEGRYVTMQNKSIKIKEERKDKFLEEKEE